MTGCVFVYMLKGKLIVVTICFPVRNIMLNLKHQFSAIANRYVAILHQQDPLDIVSSTKREKILHVSLFVPLSV